MNPTRPKARASIVSLDLVRWVAAFTVLLVHARGANWVDFGSLPVGQRTAPIAAFFSVTRLGNEAVMVFFVLSGFLVGGSLIERVRSGTFDLTRYAVDRSTRILLPLIPACLITAIITISILHAKVSATEVIANMTGFNGVLTPTLKNNDPLWSLPFEIWFYLISGGFAHLISRGPRIWNLLVIGISILVFSKLGAVYLLYWVFGALMVLVRPKHGAAAIAGLGLLGATAGAYFFEAGILSKTVHVARLVPLDAAQALVCLGFSLTLPFLSSPKIDQRLTGLARPAAALSAFSYSLYLIHFPINQMLSSMLSKNTEVNQMSIVTFLARILICILGAAVFYACFERRTGDLRRWMSARLTHRTNVQVTVHSAEAT